ncbi:MAG: hypothetical protein A2V70_11330 [Planctomycetes bacterium RBG_13_63_9]|nr:MAG: hypothetical protein A2V70_11330 [Planctomycetes bacterium RBG_13_63_9]
MVRSRANRSRRKQFPRAGLVELLFGANHVSAVAEGLGEDVAAMRAAWADSNVAEATWSLYRQRPRRLPMPWAAIAFGPDGRANPGLGIDELRCVVRAQTAGARRSKPYVNGAPAGDSTCNIGEPDDV